MSKSALRKELRTRRRALSALDQKAAARRLYRRVVTTSLFRFSRRIAFTMAADGEIDPSLLLAAAQRRGKECYLPVLSPIGAPRLRFKRWRKGEDRRAPKREREAAQTDRDDSTTRRRF